VNGKSGGKRGLDSSEGAVNEVVIVCRYGLGEVASRYSVFANEQACLAQGQLPYRCSSKTCTRIPAKDLKVNYTEWHRDPKDENGGKCVLGDFVLRQWCENPQSRCIVDQKTGKYPAGCEGSGSEPGITDVPSFLYDRNKSACYMTHDYCKKFYMDYNLEHHQCTTDAECQAHNSDWYCQTTDQGGFCTGPDSECYLPAAAKFVKHTIGKTLFSMFRGGFKKCGDSTTDSDADNVESYTHTPRTQTPRTDEEYLTQAIQMAHENFNKVTEIVGMPADETRMKRKSVVERNFAGPGINLYLIHWDKGTITVGFLASEVKSLYPNLIENHRDGKYIVIDRNEIDSDKNIKRMYLTIGSRTWMAKMIMSELKNLKKR